MAEFAIAFILYLNTLLYKLKPRYNYSLVAIVGEFLKSNLKGCRLGKLESKG